MSDVSILHLGKTYPGQSSPAVEDVSLDVRDGEFLVLLGPSGCGKTTLMRMVAGLELADAGQVVVGGRDVTYLPPRERNMSMVFQSYAVFPHRTVADNIAFGPRMRGVDRDTVARKVAWAADLLQLSPYLDRYPARLSGGQRQRVAVARAIVVDADLLLMDEPLSNLDALLRLSFRAELKKLVGEIGTTTLYVTHDQVEALSLGDRVAVMRDGRIVQCDEPMTVYDDPATEFVGSFLGSPPMNFLSGRVHGSNGATQVDLGGLRLPAPSQLAGYAGREVRLGVRPETIEVSRRDDDPNAAPSTVSVFEPLGSAVLITAELAGQEVKVAAPASFRAAPGERLWLSLAPDRMRWYDPETGAALDLRP
jgi:multiple sugar transport system ATP-binding protein